MDAVQRSLPKGLLVALLVVAATLLAYFVYYVANKDRPYRGIPLVALEGKSARASFVYHEKETLAKGRQLVRYLGPQAASTVSNIYMSPDSTLVHSKS